MNQLSRDFTNVMKTQQTVGNKMLQYTIKHFPRFLYYLLNAEDTKLTF